MTEKEDGATVIVSVGGEGGDVKLLGRRRDEGSWKFRRATNDSSWAMLGEEEIDPYPPVVIPTWVPTWNDAVRLLDRNQWALLRPLAVHPDFRADVLVEVTRRLLEAPATRRNARMLQWLTVCSG